MPKQFRSPYRTAERTGYAQELRDWRREVTAPIPLADAPAWSSKGWAILGLALIALVFAFTACGCNMEKECARRFPPIVGSHVVETVRDTTIITEPACIDTVFVASPNDTINVRKGKLRITYINHNDTVRLGGECQPDTIRLTVYSAKAQTNTYSQPPAEKSNFLRNAGLVAVSILVVSMIIGALIFGYKILKSFYPFLP